MLKWWVTAWSPVSRRDERAFEPVHARVKRSKGKQRNETAIGGMANGLAVRDGNCRCISFSRHGLARNENAAALEGQYPHRECDWRSEQRQRPDHICWPNRPGRREY